MDNRFEITFEGNYIKVISDGEKDYDFLERQWSEIAAACKQYDCRRVLGVAHTTKPVEAVEGYEVSRIFRDLEFTQEYRLAWVEHNAEGKDIVEFIEAVLTNRGLPGRSFDSEAEALEWLLSD
jgi:hypothetical protein